MLTAFKGARSHITKISLLAYPALEVEGHLEEWALKVGTNVKWRSESSHTATVLPAVETPPSALCSSEEVVDANLCKLGHELVMRTAGSEGVDALMINLIVRRGFGKCR